MFRPLRRPRSQRKLRPANRPRPLWLLRRPAVQFQLDHLLLSLRSRWKWMKSATFQQLQLEWSRVHREVRRLLLHRRNRLHLCHHRHHHLLLFRRRYPRNRNLRRKNRRLSRWKRTRSFRRNQLASKRRRNPNGRPNLSKFRRKRHPNRWKLSRKLRRYRLRFLRHLRHPRKLFQSLRSWYRRWSLR